MNRRRLILAAIAAAVLMLALVLSRPTPETSPEPGAVESTPAMATNAARTPTTAPLPAGSGEPDLSQTAPAHGVTTTSALQRLIDARGLADAEVFHATAMALDLCDDERLPKRVTVQDLIGRWQAGGELQKAAQVSAMVNRLCTGRLSLDVDPDRLARLGDPAAQMYEPGAPLADTRALLDAARSEQSGIDPDGVIRDSIRNATGMFEWLELFAMYSESSSLGALRAALPDNGLPRHISHDAVQAGARLAGCRLFGGCGAGTLLATMICINSRCPHPMGFQELTRYQLSQPVQEDAEAMARVLLTVRHAAGP